MPGHDLSDNLRHSQFFFPDVQGVIMFLQENLGRLAFQVTKGLLTESVA